jgi:hypothetical protein
MVRPGMEVTANEVKLDDTAAAQPQGPDGAKTAVR